MLPIIEHFCYYLWGTYPLPLFCPPAMCFFHPTLIFSMGHFFISVCFTRLVVQQHEASLQDFFELMIAGPPLLPASLVSFASASRVLSLCQARCALWDLASNVLRSHLFRKQVICCCCLYIILHYFERYGSIHYFYPWLSEQESSCEWMFLAWCWPEFSQ